MVKDFHLPRLITLGHCLKKLCSYLLHGGQQPSASLLVLYVYTCSKCCIYRTFHRSLSFTISLCMDRRSGPDRTSTNNLHHPLWYQLCVLRTFGTTWKRQLGEWDWTKTIGPATVSYFKAGTSQEQPRPVAAIRINQSTQKIYHKYIKTNTQYLTKRCFFLSFSQWHQWRQWPSQAEQRQPMVKVGFATEVTLTCTRGAQGVAEIQAPKLARFFSGIWDVWYTKISFSYSDYVYIHMSIYYIYIYIICVCLCYIHTYIIDICMHTHTYIYIYSI